MRTAIRKAGVACGTAFASAALAVTTATGAWGANSALVVAGLETSSLHDAVMAQLLGGALQGQQRVSVNWPAEAAPYTGAGDMSLGDSINVGITNLDAQIDAALANLAAGEKVTVVGLSAGSLVVNEVLRQLAGDANAPGKELLTFVVVADSSRQKVIDKAKYNSQYDYTYQPAPQVKYDVSVVVAEFDGTHDFPDRWWNFTAVLNSIAGGIVGHIPVMFADLSKVPSTNIEVTTNTKGGTTTTYLVPSTTLPLVQLLPFLKSQEASLRKQVEKGYSRYDNKPSAARTLAVAPAVAEEVEDTVVPAAKTTVAAAVAAEPDVEAAETVSTGDDEADAADATEADAADAADAAEADTAEADAAEADAAEAEAVEADAVEADAVEADAAESDVAEANDDEGASASDSSDDSSSSASESADSSADSE
ncbi:hypothetical protein NGTWS0302_37390 [Mycolicibacterium cyprinidarum]|uniref:PE-PPE domain-containing protein n=1 Tax=Mycolicibacterium cyprinidarum TaxID=2860311 RepID=A0ABQ4VHS4_9MYCO|nr:hypothetical protein NGTWS0302_37390 [Mycolicibacterium sp. NGTWS0302]GJF17000.1 hypothetical protein NGTWS1702_22760 [Mycolicibacterium sp. NGTWSNA01]GJF18057.1 hypothetical protein NGTWS1803_06640 [Mycolicibacterium sp. NGTWS1803]